MPDAVFGHLIIRYAAMDVNEIRTSRAPSYFGKANFKNTLLIDDKPAKWCATLANL